MGVFKFFQDYRDLSRDSFYYSFSDFITRLLWSSKVLNTLENAGMIGSIIPEMKDSHTSVLANILEDEPETKSIVEKVKILDGKVSVILPDMFVSFMATAPKFNPHYKEIKEEAETWIGKILGADDKLRKHISKIDFAFFCAIAAPEAGRAEFRTLCDWGNWVFPFDDMFDNGALRDDPVKAQEVMSSLLSKLRGEPEGIEANHVLVTIHDMIWERIDKISPQVVKARFVDAMEHYCTGVLDHVGHHSEERIPSLDEYMQTRRRGVGVVPVMALLEYAHMINIPNAIYDHKALQQLRRICSDVVMLQNDIISYAKEEAEGVPHNIITVYRKMGMSPQAAFDEAGALLKICYREWYLAQAELPQWGEALDSQVQKYIIALQNIMLASLHWHFQSDRYFGSRKEEVRKNRTIRVLDDPSPSLYDGYEPLVI